jgi:hypothetical protein
MKTTKLLLPNGVKKVGWWMIAIGIVLSLVYGIAPDGALCESWNDFRVLFGLERLQVTMDGFSGFSPESNLVNTLIGVLLVAGGVLVGFSRMKDEDEYIGHLRYESLVVALYVNSALLVLSLVLVWGLDFLSVMMYNMFSTLIVFLGCFYTRLFIAKRRLRNEE